MKLLVDEMWPPRLAEQLRLRGHDVAAVADRGELVRQPDAVIFAAAQSERRALFTENVADFLPLADAALREGRTFSGLVLTADARFPRGHPRTLGRTVRALDALLTAHSSGSMDRITWLQ